MNWGRVLASGGAALVSLLLAGCQLLPQPSAATFDPGVEHLPGPGVVVVTGQPAKAEVQLKLEYVLPDGSIAPNPEVFNPGDTVVSTTWGNPGRLRLIVNGAQCAGDFSIESDRRTEVTLRVGLAGCATVATAVGPVAS